MLKYKTEVTENQKEEIIKEFLPYVKYTAYRLSWKLPAHLSVDDLISVGLMGLMDAVSRFEPGKVKLKTYAELRIKGSMIDELRATAWIPRSMRKKIEDINKKKEAMEKATGKVPDDCDVAREMGIPIDKYFKTLQFATSSNPVSIDDFKNNKYSDSSLNIAECIPDPKAKSPLSILEEKGAKEQLAELIEDLPEKDKMVLSLYYWEELTMQEIGKVLNITESRVCQIHSQSVERLKRMIKNSV